MIRYKQSIVINCIESKEGGADGVTADCRKGVTVLELLVVVMCSAIMIGLLLPAVQTTREVSRRSRCQSNLRQIAMAIINYSDSQNKLPIGAKTAISRSQQGWNDGYGWGVAILPYMEQQSLYFQLSEPFLPFAHGPQGTPGVFEKTYQYTSSILPAGRTELSVYRCPSSLLGNHIDNPSVPRHHGYATADYKGCSGVDDDGVFIKAGDEFRRRPLWIGTNSVVDGLSNTIAVGESSYSKNIEQWPVWVGSILDDESCLFKTEPIAVINAKLNPKTLANMPSAISDDSAFSWHGPGANFAALDASVHFVSESIDPEVYGRLGSIADGQVTLWGADR